VGASSVRTPRLLHEHSQRRRITLISTAFALVQLMEKPRDLQLSLGLRHAHGLRGGHPLRVRLPSALVRSGTGLHPGVAYLDPGCAAISMSTCSSPAAASMRRETGSNRNGTRIFCFQFMPYHGYSGPRPSMPSRPPTKPAGCRATRRPLPKAWTYGGWHKRKSRAVLAVNTAPCGSWRLFRRITPLWSAHIPCCCLVPPAGVHPNGYASSRTLEKRALVRQGSTRLWVRA
jgi:hypothetical protein